MRGRVVVLLLGLLAVRAHAAAPRPLALPFSPLAPNAAAVSPAALSPAASPALPSPAVSVAATPVPATPRAASVSLAPAADSPASVFDGAAVPTDGELKSLFVRARPGSKAIAALDRESGFVPEAIELVSRYTFVGESLHAILKRSNPAYADPDYADSVRDLTALAGAGTHAESRSFLEALARRRAHDVYRDVRTAVRVQDEAAADRPAERPRHLPRNALGSGDYWDMASGLNAGNFMLDGELEPGTHHAFFDVSPFATSYLRAMASLTRSAISVVEKDIRWLTRPERPISVLRTKNAVNYVPGFENKLEEMAYWVAPGGGRLVIQNDAGNGVQRESIADKHETLAVSLLEEGWEFSYDFATQTEPKHLLDTLIFTRPVEYSVPPRSRLEAEGMWEKYRQSAAYIGRRDPF